MPQTNITFEIESYAKPPMHDPEFNWEKEDKTFTARKHFIKKVITLKVRGGLFNMFWIPTQASEYLMDSTNKVLGAENYNDAMLMVNELKGQLPVITQIK